MGEEKVKLTNWDILEFMYSLLFKDMNSIPYDNDCSQNRLVRKRAKEWGFDLIEYENEVKNSKL